MSCTEIFGVEVCRDSYSPQYIDFQISGKTDNFSLMNDLYCRAREHDAEKTCDLLQKLFGNATQKVERVIQHKQATVLFWGDGTKTVVKCRECGDDCPCLYDLGYDPETEPYTLVKKADRNPEEMKPIISQLVYCSHHFDRQKAVMAAMLKKLYPNFQDVLRENEVE